MTETFEFFINGSARPAAGGDSFATVNPYTQKQKEWARIFIAPTILTGLTNVAPIAREEVFGPVAVILPFEDDEEALAIANDTDYGLASGVWTSNISRAHRFANELEAGQVWINTYRNSGAMVPFGGVKRSGYGRARGFASIQEYTQIKNVMLDVS